MNKKVIISILFLAFIAMVTQAQTKVWNKIATGYVNLPIISITKVSIYDDRTEVFFRLEVPEQMQMAGDSVPLATKPTLRADGKDYAVKGATVISLTEPYKIPADGKVDFSLLFEPIPANTWMIDVAEPNAWFFANVHDAENLPTGIADTYWRIEATGDWLIGFTPKYVVYGNRVHGIVSQTEKKDAYTLTLDNGINVKVGKMKKGRRTIAIGSDKPISCSPITGTALPDYPTKDTRKGFVDNGYRAGDSVTIIGWLKDMPQELWQRKGREFQVGMENILSTENEQGSAYALMDSLGRFTLKMPLLNTSQAFLALSKASLALCDFLRSPVTRAMRNRYSSRPSAAKSMVPFSSRNRSLSMARSAIHILTHFGVIGQPLVFVGERKPDGVGLRYGNSELFRVRLLQVWDKLGLLPGHGFNDEVLGHLYSLIRFFSKKNKKLFLKKQ